jgi:Leucine-rich repeat (LRR) protein
MHSGEKIQTDFARIRIATTKELTVENYIFNSFWGPNLFPESLENLVTLNLIAAELNDNQISELFSLKNLNIFKNLVSLDLSKNNLKEPNFKSSCLCHLKNLNKLNLKGNNLKKADFRFFGNLSSLNLSANGIFEVSKFLFNFIVDLDLSENKIKILDDLFIQADTLNLSRNELIEVPGHLQVKKLILDGNEHASFCEILPPFEFLTVLNGKENADFDES